MLIFVSYKQDLNKLRNQDGENMKTKGIYGLVLSFALSTSFNAFAANNDCGSALGGDFAVITQDPGFVTKKAGPVIPVALVKGLAIGLMAANSIVSFDAQGAPMYVQFNDLVNSWGSFATPPVSQIKSNPADPENSTSTWVIADVPQRTGYPCKFGCEIGFSKIFYTDGYTGPVGQGDSAIFAIGDDVTGIFLNIHANLNPSVFSPTVEIIAKGYDNNGQFLSTAHSITNLVSADTNIVAALPGSLDDFEMMDLLVRITSLQGATFQLGFEVTPIVVDPPPTGVSAPGTFGSVGLGLGLMALHNRHRKLKIKKTSFKVNGIEQPKQDGSYGI